MKKCVVCGREFESAFDFDRHECAGLTSPYRRESRALRTIASLAFLLAVGVGYVFLNQECSGGGRFAEAHAANLIVIAANVCFIALWILFFPARRLWLRVIIALVVWAVIHLSLPVT